MEIPNALASDERHPVLLVGAQGTGKTCVVVSLMSHFFQRNSQPGEIGLDEPLIDPETAEGKSVIDRCRSFYYKQVNDFAVNKRVPGATGLPTIIPVRTVGANGTQFRLVFFDVRGEDFHPSAEGLPRPIEEVISKIISHYDAPLSVIVILPSVATGLASGANRDAAYRQAAQAVRNTIEVIKGARGGRIKHDHFLMLFTKWDEYDKDWALGKTNESQLSELLDARPFDVAWSAFTNIGVASSSQLKYMHYTVGAVNDGVLVIARNGGLVLEALRTKVWNWICGNAYDLNGERAALFEPVEKTRFSPFRVR